MYTALFMATRTVSLLHLCVCVCVCVCVYVRVSVRGTPTLLPYSTVSDSCVQCVTVIGAQTAYATSHDRAIPWMEHKEVDDRIALSSRASMADFQTVSVLQSVRTSTWGTPACRSE
jgi:hypothetical protein